MVELKNGGGRNLSEGGNRASCLISALPDFFPANFLIFLDYYGNQVFKNFKFVVLKIYSANKINDVIFDNPKKSRTRYQKIVMNFKKFCGRDFLTHFQVH